MFIYDLHKYILLFSLFYPEFFPVLLATNIFVIIIEKNVPRHLLASRAVTCDKLHLRASAHFGHVSAFLCNREFLGISCYIKKRPGTLKYPVSHQISILLSNQSASYPLC